MERLFQMFSTRYLGQLSNPEWGRRRGWVDVAVGLAVFVDRRQRIVKVYRNKGQRIPDI
jgi:hypothetical protein